MANTIVSVIPDPFLSTATDASRWIPKSDREVELLQSSVQSLPPGAYRPQITSAARPVSGHQVKPDKFSYAQVIRNDGKVIPILGTIRKDSESTSEMDAVDEILNLLGDGRRDIDPYPTKPNNWVWNEWLLESAQEQRVEKTQLLETFGGSFLYAYGSKPVVYAFAGKVLNTPDFNWRRMLLDNWERFFKASRLLDLSARMYIVFDEVMLEGYGMALSVSQSAGMDGLIPFTMSFLVTRRIDTGHVYRDGRDLGKLTDGNRVEWGYIDKQAGATALSERKSVLADLPIVGNDWIASGGGGIGESLGGLFSDPATAEFANDNVTRALALARSLIFSAPRGGDFLRAMVAEAGFQTLRSVGEFAANKLTDWVEESFSLPRGEVNNWFGYMGVVLGLAADTAQTYIPDTPGWVDTVLGSNAALREYIAAGTIEAVISKMSVAALGDSRGVRVTEQRVDGPMIVGGPALRQSVSGAQVNQNVAGLSEENSMLATANALRLTAQASSRYSQSSAIVATGSNPLDAAGGANSDF